MLDRTLTTAAPRTPPESYGTTPTLIRIVALLLRVALTAAMLQVLVSAWVCALLLLATVLTSWHMDASDRTELLDL